MITTDIIDLAHWEHGANIAEAAKHGLLAVWAKTSQGRDYLDPTRDEFLDAAKAAGLLCGEYHFGSDSSDGATQADWFLAHARPDSLLALDWETNPNSASAGTMTLAQAEEFVSRVREQTQRWPVLYSGLSFLRSHRIPYTSVLRNCPLWLACYGEEPQTIPSPWSAYSLWQYSDWAHGPRNMVAYPRETPGLGKRVDRSAFRGTADELKAWWASAGR